MLVATLTQTQGNKTQRITTRPLDFCFTYRTYHVTLPVMLLYAEHLLHVDRLYTLIFSRKIRPK